MTRTKRLLAAGAAVVAVAAGGAAVAIGGGDDDDAQATGPGAEKARAAALELIPGGTANAVELDSEDGATWEVEVTRPDGGTVDVRLDERYDVVVIEGDSEDPDEGDE